MGISCLLNLHIKFERLFPSLETLSSARPDTKRHCRGGDVRKGDQVSNLATLHVKEPVRLDSDRLSTLYFQLGEVSAETIMCRAMEELAVRLSELQPLLQEGDYQRLAKVSRSLIGIAEQIGMASLARVAGDVTECAMAGNLPALSATLNRLNRIGDMSLMAIWDLRDMRV
ncbi:MAG: hypothetical protein ACJA1E_000846 [Paracoccaceae bacterium]